MTENYYKTYKEHLDVAQALLQKSDQVRDQLKNNESALKYFEKSNSFLRNVVEKKIKGNILLLGPQSSGKTQLLNSLIEQNIYPSKGGECTQYIIFHSWREQGSKYQLYNAELKEISGQYVPEKIQIKKGNVQTDDLVAEGVQNIYNHLDNHNRQYYNQKKKYLMQLQKEYEQNQYTKDDNQTNEELLQKIEALSKIKVYIYEGPIPKFDEYGPFLKENFYLLDLPGIDSEDQNKKIQAMKFLQPSDNVFSQTKISVILCDINHITQPYFIEIVTDIAKNSDVQQEQKEEFQHIFSSKGQKKEDDHEQIFQKKLKNHFLAINKMDHGNPADLDELINENLTVQNNQYYKELLQQNQYFRISGLNSFKYSMVTGQYDTYEQIKMEKSSQLSQFLKNKDFQDFVEKIFTRCNNLEKFDYYQENEFMALDTEFYSILYGSEGQKVVQKLKNKEKYGVEDFVKSMSEQIIQIYLNNFKLQIFIYEKFIEIYNENDFNEAFKFEQNDEALQEIQEVIIEWDKLLQDSDIYFEQIDIKNEKYEQNMCHQFEILMETVKSKQIHQINSQFKQIKDEFEKNLKNILKDEYQQETKIIQDNFKKKIMDSLKNNNIPYKIKNILEARIKTEFASNCNINNICDPEIGVLNFTNILSYVSFIGAASISIAWVVRAYQTAQVAGSIMLGTFNPIGFGIGVCCFIASGIGSIFITNHLKKNAQQQFQDQLNQQCVILKDMCQKNLKQVTDHEKQQIRKMLELLQNQVTLLQFNMKCKIGITQIESQ